MKLQYKVLWFDDSAEIFDSMDFDYLNGEVEGWGFVPVFDLVTTAQEFNSKAPYAEYDLLVFDYDLQEEGHGENFISRVRQQEVFTEIIFYSSGSASLLWQAVHAHQLEGIYVANKETIAERILKVGQQTLRKVLDLENMRGIVMAEVGDLDLLLEKIIFHAMEGLDGPAKEDIFVRFAKALRGSHEKHGAVLEAFNAGPTTEMLLSLCDSNKRWENYRRTSRHHGVLKEKTLGDYVQEILGPRNFLAHGVPRKAEDGSHVFSYQGREYTFSEETSVALRAKIIEYKGAFTEIVESISKNTGQSAVSH